MNYTQEQLNITESILHIQNQSIDSSKKKKPNIHLWYLSKIKLMLAWVSHVVSNVGKRISITICWTPFDFPFSLFSEKIYI